VLGDFRRAIELYNEHLAITREIGDRRGEGNTLSNLGKSYVDLGDLRRAIVYLRGALDILETIESPNAVQARATIAGLDKRGGT
jgi:tetratricopeptide (TPR) repeat protein